MNKLDLALNNIQWLICHKTKPNQTKPNLCTLRNMFHPHFFLIISLNSGALMS